MLSTWPFWESSLFPCPAPAQLAQSTGPPMLRVDIPRHGRRELGRERGKQQSPRECSSPSFIYGSIRDLASLLPSCTAQVPSCHTRPFHVEIPDYRVRLHQKARTKRQARLLSRLVSYYYIARGDLSPFSPCTSSVPRLNTHSNEACHSPFF
jgi:hypothetical protein